MTTLIRPGQKPGAPAFAATAAAAGNTAAEYVRRERAYGARNYDPLPVVLSAGRRLVADRRRRAPLPRPDERVLGRELRPRASEDRRRADRAGAAARGHVARVLQRPAAAAAREAGRDVPASTARFRSTPASRPSRPRSRRRASGRTRSRACRKGAPRSSAARATSTGARSRRSGCRPSRSIATGSARIRRGSSTVPFGDAAALEAAITPNTAAFLVEPVQGEARHRRAARRLSRALRAHLPPPSRAADLRRGADGPRPHRPHVRLASTTA